MFENFRCYIGKSFDVLSLGRSINNRTQVLYGTRRCIRLNHSIQSLNGARRFYYNGLNAYIKYNAQHIPKFQCIIYNSFTLSATNNGGKKSKNKPDKSKAKNSSAFDDILDDLSDDEEEDTNQKLDDKEYQGKRTPAYLFVEGMRKGGSAKGILL